MNSQRLLALAALLLALAVIFGAFGAHALAKRLDPAMLDIWHKANFYHFVHALGLFVIALLVPLNIIPAPVERITATFMLVGIVLFSGSLYLLALSGIKILGAITPFGGISFIVGWVYLAMQLLKRPG